MKAVQTMCNTSLLFFTKNIFQIHEQKFSTDIKDYNFESIVQIQEQKREDAKTYKASTGEMNL